MDGILLYLCPKKMKLKEHENSKYYYLHYVLVLQGVNIFFLFFLFSFIKQQKKCSKIPDIVMDIFLNNVVSIERAIDGDINIFKKLRKKRRLI